MQNNTQQTILHIIKNLDISSNERSTSGLKKLMLAKKHNRIDNLSCLFFIMTALSAISLPIYHIWIGYYSQFLIIVPFLFFAACLYGIHRLKIGNKEINYLKQEDNITIFNTFSNYQTLTDLFKCLQEFSNGKNSTFLSEGFQTAYDLIEQKNEEKFASHIQTYIDLFMSQDRKEQVAQESSEILKKFNLDFNSNAINENNLSVNENDKHENSQENIALNILDTPGYLYAK